MRGEKYPNIELKGLRGRGICMICKDSRQLAVLVVSVERHALLAEPHSTHVGPSESASTSMRPWLASTRVGGCVCENERERERRRTKRLMQRIVERGQETTIAEKPLGEKLGPWRDLMCENGGDETSSLDKENNCCKSCRCCCRIRECYGSTSSL